MPLTARFATLLVILSVPVDPVAAQARLEPIPNASRLAPALRLADGPTGREEIPESGLGFGAHTVPQGAAGPVTVILSGTATGIFFGAILGGIYGQNQEGCNQCDFWGAVSGGFIGGLVGLAAGVLVSVR